MTSRCPELYFAYGSNLSEERLRKRVGEFGPARVARLEGYRLAFNKRSADGSTVYASIVPAAGATTWAYSTRSAKPSS